MGKYSHFINLTGQTFGRLKVIKRFNKQGESPVEWLCSCQCGNQKVVKSQNLRNGTTNSCGCLRSECSKSKFTTHGKSKSRTYKIWSSMRTRCNNKKTDKFEYYGARGIKICERWNSFENFLEDMGEAPENKSIDRIDVNGNYEPSNCRWATHQEQSENRRERKSFNEFSLRKFLKEQNYLTEDQKNLLIKSIFKTLT